MTCPLLCAALRPNENSVAEFQLGMLGSQVVRQRSQDIREFTGYSDSLQQAIAFIPRENERRTIRPFGIGPTLDINLAPLAEVVEYSSPPPHAVSFGGRGDIPSCSPPPDLLEVVRPQAKLPSARDVFSSGRETKLFSAPTVISFVLSAISTKHRNFFFRSFSQGVDSLPREWEEYNFLSSPEIDKRSSKTWGVRVFGEKKNYAGLSEECETRGKEFTLSQ